MSVFKKTVTLAAAVSLVCLYSVGAMAASKLIVKDSTGTTDKFVVDDRGYIGVGTTPVSGLNMVGTTLQSTQLRVTIDSTTASDSGSFLFMRTNANGTNSLPLNINKLGAFYFGSTDSGTLRQSASIIGYASANWSSTSTPSHIAFTTTPVGSISTTERMRINWNGNVGIGTTSPQAKLDVSGGIRLNSTGTRDSCSSTNSGMLWLDQSVNPNILYICAGAGGTPTWRTITIN